jgi:hypothetical protein
MKRLGLAFLLVFFFAAPASAWWTKGYIPACDASAVIDKIKIRFAYADTHAFRWGVSIHEVTDTSERAPIVKARNSLIGRRYCSGIARLSDGSRHEVVYLIESRQGFAGVGFNVESCLPGYDPWHTYDGWCQSIRP